MIRMIIKNIFFLSLLIVILLTQKANANEVGVIPFPYRIGGTVTVDGIQLTTATDTGYIIKVFKSDGSAYLPPAEDGDGLNEGSNWYLIDIPLYEPNSQPGGAHIGETAVVHIYKDDQEITIIIPINGQITVGSSGPQQVDLVAETSNPPLIISGHVKLENGAGVLGVVLTGIPGSPATDGQGYYSGTVTYGWSGEVTPDKVGYHFLRVSNSYSNLTSDREENYTAFQNTYTISGYIKTSDGFAVNNVFLTGLPNNPSTNDFGFYSAEVVHGWSGMVTPAKDEYTFSPDSWPHNDVTSDEEKNYTTTINTYIVSGYIRTFNGDGVGGVTMTGLPDGSDTNSNGYYSGIVPFGWSGAVTPTKDGHFFEPQNLVFTSVSSDLLDQNFTRKIIKVEMPGTASESDHILPIHQGTVAILEAFAESFSVNLSSSDISELVVPSIVVIPAGQTSVFFDLTVVNDNELDGTQTVEISASAESWTSGSAFLQVMDDDADLSIAIQDTPDPVISGRLINYILSVTNTSKIEALNVRVEDLLPREVQNPQFSSDGESWDLWDGSFNLGTITVGETKEFQIRGIVMPSTRSSIVNIASVTSDADDPILTNNTASEITKIRKPMPWLTLLLDDDQDNDGIKDHIEQGNCTDPNNSDTDGDGILDGIEDVNKNGVRDPGETDPCQADSDSDQISDGTEQDSCTDPNIEDTDGDGILDGIEDVNKNGVKDPEETDPCRADTDGDLLEDDIELKSCTDPNKPDTDRDGLADGIEDANHNGLVDPGETNPCHADLNTISGFIRTLDGNGLEGVVVNGLPNTPRTDDSGYYTADVIHGWSGTVAPSKAGHMFAPSVRAYTGVSSNLENQDYFHKIFKVEIPELLSEGDMFIANGKVTIPGALPADLAFSLSSSDTTEVNVPSTLTIPAGQISIVFDLTVVNDKELDGNQPVEIIASTEGWTLGLAHIQVMDNDADLSITIQDTPDPVISRRLINYVLSVTNTSKIEAPNVIVEDILPRDIQNPEFSLDGESWELWNGIYNFVTIAVGETKEIQIRGIVAPSTSNSMVNTASVTSDADDPILTNNTTSERTSIRKLLPWLSLLLDDDYDDDGISNFIEEGSCTDPDNADTDGDGIPDGIEDVNKNGVRDPGETDPCQADSDSDQISDGTEQDSCTDPNLEDTDGDGILDGIEDVNRNGVRDPGETDPCQTDTDSDGMSDGWEVEYSLNPLVNDANGDADGDRFSNLREYQMDTIPNDHMSYPRIGLPWLQLLLNQ